MTLRGRFGATYQIRARANGSSGGASRWFTATTVMPSAIPRGQYRGRWTTTKMPGAWGGRAIIGRPAGASYSVQFVGGSLSVVGETSPQGGVALLTLDGKTRTIRLHSTRLRARRVLFAARLAVGRHRLQIRVARGLVGLEGLGIANRRS
jgi:hypothetical protein